MVAWAFIRRNALMASTYRFTYVMKLVGALGTLVSLSLLARFVGNGDPNQAMQKYGQGGYLGFWVTGFAVAMVFETSAAALSRRIRSAQLEGTLEAMLATPAPIAYVVLATPLWDLVGAVLRTALTVGGAVLLFGLHIGPVAWPAFLACSILGFLGALSLGVLGAALAMTFRRPEPISLLVGVASILVGGVLYPVAVLPSAVQWVAYAFPLGPALVGIRRSLFAGTPLSELQPELTALALFLVIVGPLAAWAFSAALRRARDDGSLSQY